MKECYLDKGSLAGKQYSINVHIAHTVVKSEDAYIYIYMDSFLSQFLSFLSDNTKKLFHLQAYCLQLLCSKCSESPLLLLKQIRIDSLKILYIND